MWNQSVSQSTNQATHTFTQHHIWTQPHLPPHGEAAAQDRTGWRNVVYGLYSTVSDKAYDKSSHMLQVNLEHRNKSKKRWRRRWRQWRQRGLWWIFIVQPFSRIAQISCYQNVSIPDFIGAKDDGGGGDNWSYKMCKTPVKSSLPTNQHPTFYRLDDLPVAKPTALKHWRGKVWT